MNFIVSSIVGDVYEKNNIVNKCLHRWLESHKGEGC